MFQYEFEKRPSSSNSCDSRATMTTDWSRRYSPSVSRECPGESRGYRTDRASPGTSRAPSPVRTYTGRVTPSAEKARRPLPPRPIVCERIPAMPSKTIVPLKVWIIASASCFAVCAALVLATIVITKWSTTEHYAPQTQQDLYGQAQEHIYSPPIPETSKNKPEIKTSEELNDINFPILEKLSIFKNIVANRERKKTDLNLSSKPQMHPIHDTSLHHPEKRIEKKDQAKLPKAIDDTYIPEFKPTLPDVFINKYREIKLADGFIADPRKHNSEYYEDYYNDENLYEDYMQSNTMTSYLIEKVQELHDWITSDPDFKPANSSKKFEPSSQFGEVLKALNESLVEGNVTIVMNKLKNIYFGDNFTNVNHTRKVIVSNSTDLLSFGILTLDVMLLHNIQLMAWENQEPARIKMLKDPDVFAFNALFLEPNKVEAKQNEIQHYREYAAAYAKRQSLRQNQDLDDFDLGKNLLENVLEMGMSTARAAIHLGRAYKNTKMALNQLSNRDFLKQNQISRNLDGNTHALNHLQITYSKNDSVTNVTSGFYTELDCIWLLYCKNLAATAKLAAPYGVMARINGMALRMLTGELSADRALDTMLYEALTGWTELRCTNMFPRCSKVNAATVVMDSILQPLRKQPSRSL